MTVTRTFDLPDRCVVGTVGGPGERAFYLQVRDGAVLYSMIFEKEQARLLALRMGELLEEATARGDISQRLLASPADNAPLDMPLTEEFRIMRMSVAWLRQDHHIVIEAASGSDDDEAEVDADDDTATSADVVVSIRLTPSDSKEFVRRTLAVVAAGRRSCPLCEQPIHPSGHICPRANGYHRLR